MRAAERFRSSGFAILRIQNDERAARRRPFLRKKPAATYSPGRLPAKYHRRREA